MVRLTRRCAPGRGGIPYGVDPGEFAVCPKCGRAVRVRFSVDGACLGFPPHSPAPTRRGKEAQMNRRELVATYRAYVRAYGPLYAWSHFAAHHPTVSLEELLEAWKEEDQWTRP